MSEYPIHSHIHCWKRLEDGSITYCDLDDPEIGRVDFKSFGRNGPVSPSFHRSPDQTPEQFKSLIIKIKRLMEASFDQGQRHRAGVIRNALECTF